MKFILYISLLIVSINVNGQQDAVYSQYLFNPFAINPAYAGSREAINVTLINRSQWVGLDGAPQTQTLAAHVPMNRKNLAWGIQLSNDKLGPSRNLVALGTAAYRLRLENGNLHIGLRGGIYNGIIDHQALEFREENDILDFQSKVSAIVPTFDFGLYYYTEKLFVGFSVNHITKHRFNFNEVLGDQNYLRRHFFLSTGYVFELNPNFIFKPSVMVKYAGQGMPNVDLNAHLLVHELFWVGLGLRNKSSLNFLLDVNVTNYLRIGYSYDMSFSKIKTFSHGSHEFLIGFDFNTQSQTQISNRFL